MLTYGSGDYGTGVYGEGVDASAPDTSITFSPPNPDTTLSPNFSFTATEPVSAFEIRVDGGAWINVGASGNTSLTGITAYGSHTFEVRAIDTSGNVDPTPASYTWTINQVLPDLPPYNPLEPKRVEWKFVLADSATMANIGELQCTNKQLELVLNRAGSCSFAMPMKNPLADQISVLTTCIKVYRKTPTATTLIWSGPVWNIEDVVHSEVMTVSAVGWLEILNHRFLRYEKRYTNNDKTAGQIALDLLAVANAQKDGPLSPANPDGNGTTRPTGILVGTTSDTGLKNRIYPQWQSIGQAITEWSDIENGYDFEVTPDTKTLNIYASAFPGTLRRDRPQAQFGFNWGPHNLLEFSRTYESVELINSQFAIGKFNTQALSQNLTSIGLYGLWENSQTLSDITDPNVLAAFANGEVAVRSTPKTVYKFLPHPYSVEHTHVPQPFVDYRIGDHVYVTAKYSPRVLVNQQAMRVYGITVSIGDDGAEKISSIQVSP